MYKIVHKCIFLRACVSAYVIYFNSMEKQQMGTMWQKTQNKETGPTDLINNSWEFRGFSSPCAASVCCFDYSCGEMFTKQLMSRWVISQQAKEAAEAAEADEAVRPRLMTPPRLMSRQTDEANEPTRLMMVRLLRLMRRILLARPLMPLKPIEPTRLMQKMWLRRPKWPMT